MKLKSIIEAINSRGIEVRQVEPGLENEKFEEFAKKHYLRDNSISGVSIRLGVFYNNEMIGIVGYGSPTYNMMYKQLGLNRGEVYELRRLFVEDVTDLHNAESQIISLANDELKELRPEIKVVVTYADPSVGHLGTVYQATNAIYLGKGEGPSGKHKYIYLLGSKSEKRHTYKRLKIKQQPYPQKNDSKLKEIVKSLKLEDDNSIEQSDVNNYTGMPVSTKSINDEFEVNDWMLKEIEQTLEKVNKKLTARNMPPLELKILKSDWVEHKPKGVRLNGLSVDDILPIKKLIHTIKIEGDIPEIKDYEFIAKIEHSSDGNIINMAPNRSVEKLPDVYKTSHQKCDICHTDRERNNTFIIKKVETDELICAGSSCLKKFMPLDVVKAMIDYSIQLNDLRNALVDYESRINDDGEEESEYFGGGGGGGRYNSVYEPITILTFCLIAFLENGKTYVSKKKAEEWGKSSTLSEALSIIYILNSPPRNDEDRRQLQRVRNIVANRKDEATDLANKILQWAKSFDFDAAAIASPAMDAYYNNLKILVGRNSIDTKHLGYFASIISLYLRDNEMKREKKVAKENTYYGEIGQKIVDIPVEVKFTTSFETDYGWMHVYNMLDDEGHIFVYKGKILAFETKGSLSSDNYHPIGKDDKLLLSGTIKAHTEYKDKKQTVIQRPKIKELENTNG